VHRGYFHAVTRGSCALVIAKKQRSLASGDWIFVLGGTPHVLADKAATPARPLPQIYAKHGAQCGGVLRHGGNGAGTTLVSFSFSLKGAWLNRVLDDLPTVLHVKADGASIPTRHLDALIQLVAAEMEGQRPGHELIATRLADALFVHALRAHLEAFPATSGGWLRALEDTQTGAVMKEIHARPAEPWTVETMAKACGMSRSAFAARFQRLVGEGPLSYLTRWRMHLACEMLAGDRQSIASIASAVGYESEGAFGKAFKREVGSAPGAYRRQLAP
jgi:AraC-like DNA-binding protein